jgi:hypothetical protein
MMLCGQDGGRVGGHDTQAGLLLALTRDREAALCAGAAMVAVASARVRSCMQSCVDALFEKRSDAEVGYARESVHTYTHIYTLARTHTHGFRHLMALAILHHLNSPRPKWYWSSTADIQNRWQTGCFP